MAVEDSVKVASTTDALADSILDVVQSYGMHTKTNNNETTTVSKWDGRLKFKKHVEHWIRLNEPIRFVIPSFPFKSENPDKVTCSVPDMSEYIGLFRLHAMTLDIQQVYPLGAEVTVASDGAVFNDIYPTSDEKVWEYSQSMNQMAKTYGFNVRICSPHELLKLPNSVVNRESYIDGLVQCRSIINTRTKPELLDDLFARDPDSLRTYTQMSRFYEVDLKHTPVLKGKSRQQGKTITKRLARATMARSEAFTGLVLEALPNHVRLSVHASSGMVKLSFPLVPQGSDGASTFRVPWMSSIAVSVSGECQSVFSGDVRDTHDLVYKDGNPWCYRERHELFQFESNDIVLEHIFPRGLVVINNSDKASTMSVGDIAKARELQRLQPVYVFGFGNLTDGLLKEDLPLDELLEENILSKEEAITVEIKEINLVS
ncbi:Pyoverdine/dityrosine biosynthesis domain-containing protein, partial [Trichoderma sp. SZMC 28013]